jgi:hypothetical protein
MRVSRTTQHHLALILACRVSFGNSNKVRVSKFLQNKNEPNDQTVDHGRVRFHVWPGRLLVYEEEKGFCESSRSITRRSRMGH